jgi:hypothetical protein
MYSGLEWKKAKRVYVGTYFEYESPHINALSLFPVLLTLEGRLPKVCFHPPRPIFIMQHTPL